MKINRDLSVAQTVRNSLPPKLPLPGTSALSYREFIQHKVTIAKDHGVPVDAAAIHPALKPHQRDVVEWALRGGRRAIFAAFGLGKTLIQLEIARQILSVVDGAKALIVCPLGVRQEFARDAKKIGLDTKFVRTDDDIAQIDYVRERPVFLTNYESVREGKIDVSQFTMASLDEAAILRSFGGTKTYREFMRRFENVKYRFVATATPDPNEFIELLAYSAYLGVFEKFPDELTAYAYVEKRLWPSGPVCPRCKAEERISKREKGRPGLYCCNACQREFTVKIGTIFEDSKVPLHKWLYAMYIVVTARKGVSSLQLAKEIGITQKMATRFLEKSTRRFPKVRGS